MMLGLALELEPSSTSEWKSRFQAVRIKHSCDCPEFYKPNAWLQ